MLVAGHETTVNGLAGVLFEVLRRHGIRDQLVADPTLVRAAVDEGMRIPSFYGFCRRALEDTEVSGVSIPATPAKGVHTVATAGVTKYLL
jgi:cytochrome P450